MKKLLPMFALAAVLMVPIMSAYAAPAPPSTATGSVIIPSTCGVSFTSGNPINFGMLSQGEKSAQQTLTLHNTGNTPSAPTLVQGTDWLDGILVSQMAVGQTAWSLTSGGSPPGTYTALTSGPATIVTSLPTSPDTSTYWQLNVMLTNPTTFSGTLSQTLTFTATC